MQDRRSTTNGLERLRARGVARLVMLPVLVLGLGVWMSVEVAELVQERSEAATHTEFRLRASAQVQLVLHELDNNIGMVTPLAALHEASQQVAREEFDRFVARVVRRRQAVLEVTWAPRVDRAERAAFEAAASAGAFGAAGDFRIMEDRSSGGGGLGMAPVVAAQRNIYFPVVFRDARHSGPRVEGLDLAYDMGDDAAIWRSIRGAEPALTAPLWLATPNGRVLAAAVFMPIYARPDGAAGQPATADARVEAVRGVVSATLVVGTIVRSLAASGERDVLLAVDDESGEPVRLYEPAGWEGVADTPLTHVEREIVGGRTWVFRAKPTASFIEREATNTPTGVLATGVLASALLAVLIFGVGSQSRARGIIAEHGRELQAANRVLGAEIAERRASEEMARAHEQKFREFASAVPDVLWMLVPDPPRPPRVEFVSDAIERMWGISAEVLEADPEAWQRAIHPEDRERVQRSFRAWSESADDLPYEAEYRIVRGSETRWIRDVGRKVRDAGGRPIRFVGVAEDVTDRKAAEEAVRASESRLQLALSAGRMGAFDWELSTGWVTSSDEHAHRWGFAPQAMDGTFRLFGEHIHPEDAAGAMEAVEVARQHGTEFRREYRVIEAAGGLRWVEARGRFVYAADGKAVRMTGVVMDISDRKREEQRGALMMAELNHRVKNNMAAVLSLARQTARGVSDLREFEEVFTGRVRSLSRMHTMLARMNWEGVNVGELVSRSVEAFRGEAGGVKRERAALEGERVVVPSRAAMPLAMALHELATNAAKYGSLSTESGTLRVRWSVEDRGHNAERLVLVWEEAGGPEVHATRRGFGSELIEQMLAHELGGRAQLDMRPQGVRCVLEVPLKLTEDSGVER